MLTVLTVLRLANILQILYIDAIVQEYNWVKNGRIFKVRCWTHIVCVNIIKLYLVQIKNVANMKSCILGIIWDILALVLENMTFTLVV